MGLFKKGKKTNNTNGENVVNNTDEIANTVIEEVKEDASEIKQV